MHADLAGNSPSTAVAALVTAGIAVTSAAPRNRLEDVFLDLVGATGMGGSVMSPIHQDRSADAAVKALDSMPAPGVADASGVAVGYRPGRTLPFGVELRRQLKRRRTQFTLGFMVLLPIILAIAFAIGERRRRRAAQQRPRASIIDLAQNGAGNFAMVTMIFSATFLLIVVISLFFGDTIASEASWSSLRYLLALPVPRSTGPAEGAGGRRAVDHRDPAAAADIDDRWAGSGTASARCPRRSAISWTCRRRSAGC